MLFSGELEATFKATASIHLTSTVTMVRGVASTHAPSEFAKHVPNSRRMVRRLE